MLNPCNVLRDDIEAVAADIARSYHNKIFSKPLMADYFLPVLFSEKMEQKV